MLAVLQSRLIWFCIGQLSTPLRLRGQVRHRLLTDFGSRAPTGERLAGTLALQRGAGVKADGEESPGAHAKAGSGAPSALNTRLAEWWALDFAAFRSELRKGLKAEIPVKERQQWEEALAGWRGQHDAFTARLIAVEQGIDERVCRLFGLSDADRRLLADHAGKSMVDYPYGAV